MDYISNIIPEMGIVKIIDLYKDSSEYQISLKNKSRLEGLI